MSKKIIRNITLLLLAIITSQAKAQCPTSNSPSFMLFSPNGYTVGCGSTSVCSIIINNAQTNPITGGPISYTILAPGSSTVLPTASLSSNSAYTVNVPGTWSVVVKDNTSGCTTWSTVTIFSNTTPPILGSVTGGTLTCATPTTVLQVSPNPAVNFNWLFTGVPSGVPGNSISVITPSNTPSTQTFVDTYTLVGTDNNNLCTSYSIIPIYQNVFRPNAAIVGGLAGCQHTIVLTNQSTTGIPNGLFPATLGVVGLLWEGPSPQLNVAMSSTYLAQTTGIYTMTVLDMNNGCTSTTNYTFIAGLTAAFVHTITGGQAVFNDASYSNMFTTTYFWDFGDGNTSTLQNPTHTYLNGGAHLVKFKIMDLMMPCIDSVIQSVNVSGLPCSANSGFSMVPTGTAQIWNVIPSYPWNVTTASWDWGDGSGSNTLYTSHQYSAAGMYNICLSVTVSCAASSSTCATYSVYRSSEAAMIVAINVVAPELISGLSPVESNGQLSLNIVPNPNTGEFTLNLGNANSGSLRIVISDLMGRIVYEQSPEPGSTTIRADNLPPGMYLVTLVTGNQKVTKRMVVYR